MGDLDPGPSRPKLADAQRDALLRNSGVEGWHNTCSRDSWGFSKDLPNLKDGKNTDSDLYLSELERSSTFACPDSVAAMLRAYYLPAEIFQGSCMKRDHGAEKDKVLQDAREKLKADIQLAWSQEAVERGVEHARDEEFGAARQCYKQALEIFPENVDALVALGAAHANQKRFEEALDCFDKALGLRPEDNNALKYKQAVEQRLEVIAQPSTTSDGGYSSEPVAEQATPIEHSRDDFGRDAAEEQQAPPAVPRGALAMDTHEALRIVSSQYKRRVLGSYALRHLLPISMLELPCMDLRLQYDAFLAAWLQGFERGHSFNGGSQEEEEAQAKKEKEGTQAPQETQEAVGG